MFEKVLRFYKDSEYDEKSHTLSLKEEDIFSAVELTFKEGGEYLLDITITDYLDYVVTKESRFALVYIIRHKKFQDYIILKAYLKEPKCLSICHLYKAADWLERECYDQYGVVFQNHPNLSRILNHWQFKGHPLRKDYPITKGQLCTDAVDLMPQMNEKLLNMGLVTKDKKGNFSEPSKDLMFINIGPSHPATHGTIRNFCAMDGESVIANVSEIGYLHRGFEKSCENHTYNQIIPYTDRLDYCSATTNNVAFAKTIEEMLGIQLPPRAIAIRVLVMELSRVINHLVCLAAQLVDMGALTNYWYLYNPRESSYNFFSKLTGARLTNSYMRIGGMSYDLYEGYEDDLKIIIKEIEEGVGTAFSLVEHNRIFQDRTQNICSISAEDALSFGLSGPNLRACGVNYDMRNSNPYYLYKDLDFDVVLGSVGDIYDRIMVRFEEIRQSVRIMKQLIGNIPDGNICVDNPAIILPPKEKVYGSIEGTMNQFKLIYEGVKVPAQEYYSSIEATNGELGFYVVSNGTGYPHKVKVKAPSFTAMAAYTSMVEGSMLADAVLNLGSINIIAGEMDR
ncbi:NADH-quinone oxidoreductase subunit D [Sulfurimonas sp. MAG313]|nr:NADH-quinone oxidoreductase subunit D [Sulfurimonas sp. MAG313]